MDASRRMRDGSVVTDPRLGRLVQFDERSKAPEFHVRRLMAQAWEPKRRGRSWYIRPRLDQGSSSHCVGYSVVHRWAGYPVPARGLEIVPWALVDRAAKVYGRAQQIDPWPGQEPSYYGTSVLAGCKAAVEFGMAKSYHWAFGADQALEAVSTVGPVILGTVWLESMFRPRPSGLLEVDRGSRQAGGHAYVLRGELMRARLKGEPGSMHVARITNSWGSSWSINGDAFIRYEDLGWLLEQNGEAVVLNEG